MQQSTLTTTTIHTTVDLHQTTTTTQEEEPSAAEQQQLSEEQETQTHANAISAAISEASDMTQQIETAPLSPEKIDETYEQTNSADQSHSEVNPLLEECKKDQEKGSGDEIIKEGKAEQMSEQQQLADQSTSAAIVEGLQSRQIESSAARESSEEGKSPMQKGECDVSEQSKQQHLVGSSEQFSLGGTPDQKNIKKPKKQTSSSDSSSISSTSSEEIGNERIKSDDPEMKVGHSSQPYIEEGVKSDKSSSDSPQHSSLLNQAAQEAILNQQQVLEASFKPPEDSIDQSSESQLGRIPSSGNPQDAIKPAYQSIEPIQVQQDYHGSPDRANQQVHNIGKQQYEGQLPQGEIQEDEFEEEDLEDDDRMVSQTSFVIEVSPKGRFKRFGEELGRGAYKIVYKGVDNETGREIAWNVINLNRLPKQDRVRIKSEIELIKKLEHKNIIHFISAWYNKEKEQVVFITELIAGGSLRKYVKRIKTPRLKVIKGWCREILQGLSYLHDQKPHPIIHRDLKCDNIFINSNSGEIRIGDLGLSTPMQNSFTTSVLGTPEFMAPEIYEECYGASVDIYAFGMCVLEMLTLERPYKECNNPAQIYNKVIHGIRPQALERIKDEEVKDFILLCLSRADNRPSAKDLLESKFLNELDSDKNNHEVQVTRSQSKEKIKAQSTVDPPIESANNAIAYGLKQLRQRIGSTIIEEDEENSGEISQKQGLTSGTVIKTDLSGSPGKSKSGLEVEESKSKGDSKLVSPSRPGAANITDQAINLVQINSLLQKSACFPDPMTDTHHFNQQNQPSPQSGFRFSHKDQIMTTTQPDKVETATTNSDADQPRLLHEQAKLSSPDTKLKKNSNNGSGSRKKRKNDRKKKKRDEKKQLLDESVSFLQQIDEQKQRKFEERSILFAKKREEEDDDNAQGGGHHNQGNILDELIRQDMLEEQKVLLERNLGATKGPGLSFSLQRATEKSDDKSIPFRKQPAMINSDSSDAQIAQFHKKDSLPNKDKDGNDGAQTRKFGVEKKFKEDQALQSPMTALNKKSMSYAALKQQTFGKTVHSKSKQQVVPSPLDGTKPSTQPGSNDDIKRTQSQLNTGQHIQPQPIVSDINRSSAPMTTNSHNINPTAPDKKNFPPIEQHNLQFTPSQQQLQRQSSQTFPQSQFVNQQQQESVFDVQTSSSSESSDNAQEQQDSEVDKIQLAQQEALKLPTGFDQAQIDSHKASLPRQNTQQNLVKTASKEQDRTSTPKSAQKSGNAFTYQVAPATIQKPNINGGSGLAQAQSQKQTMTLPPLAKSDQKPQKQSLLMTSASNELSKLNPPTAPGPNQTAFTLPASQQPKTQPKKEEVKTVMTQPIGGGTLQKHNTSVEVTSQKDSYYKLLYKMDGKEVRFDFDTLRDTPEGVAREMVRELSLNESLYEVIFKQIQSVIFKKDGRSSLTSTETPGKVTEKPATTNLAQTSSQPQATNKPQGAGQAPPVSQTHQPLTTQNSQEKVTTQSNGSTTKKQSPSKLSKDFAMSMFTKLLQDIEFFYSQMQNVGIGNTEEIVEAMDCSSDEKSVRMALINKVLLAKREYKSSLEQYRQKQKKATTQPTTQGGASTSATQPLEKAASTQKSTTDVHNLTFSMPTAGPSTTIPNPIPIAQPTTAAQLQATISKQKLQQSPPTLSQITISQEKVTSDEHGSTTTAHQHGAARKQNSFEINQPQLLFSNPSTTQIGDKKKVTYVVPHYIKEHFRSSPQTFHCLSKLSKNLKKLNYDDILEQPDEEVIQLQNLLNFMWHDSIILHSQKAQNTQEQNELIQKHVPLKVDGIFGDRTEKCVIKFQKYKEILQNGVVNEYVWSLMLDHADQIIIDSARHQSPLTTQSSTTANTNATQQKDQKHTTTKSSEVPSSSKTAVREIKKPPSIQTTTIMTENVQQSAAPSSPNKQSKQQQQHQQEQIDYNLLMEKFYANQQQQQQQQYGEEDDDEESQQ